MFEGLSVAMVTPFRDGRLDEEAVDRLLDHLHDGGVIGVVPADLHEGHLDALHLPEPDLEQLRRPPVVHPASEEQRPREQSVGEAVVAAEVGVFQPAGLATQPLVRELFSQQHPDGHWGDDETKPYTAKGALGVLDLLYMLGVEPDLIRTALERYRSIEKRMQISRMAGCTFINDTYNANIRCDIYKNFDLSVILM